MLSMVIFSLQPHSCVHTKKTKTEKPGKVRTLGEEYGSIMLKNCKRNEREKFIKYRRKFPFNENSNHSILIKIYIVFIFTKRLKNI